MGENTADNEDDEHKEGSGHHKLPTTNSVGEIDGRRQTRNIVEEVTACKERRFVALVARQRERLRSIRGDEVNTRALLHDLHASAEKDAPPGVQLVLLGQHFPVRGCGLAGLEADGGDDLGYLVLDLGVVRGDAAALQDLARLADAARLDEVAGGLGEEGRSRHDHEEEDDLKTNWEAPGKFETRSPQAGVLGPVDAGQL